MELPTYIKSEKTTFEDANENFLAFDYHIKFENGDTEYDYYIQEPPVRIELSGDGSYNELTKHWHQKCDICDRLFADKYTLLQHNMHHLSVPLVPLNTYQCEHCFAYITTKKNLIRHIKNKHSNNTVQSSKILHECNICHKVFKYKNWHAHVTNVHGEQNALFKCLTCNIPFKCVKYLKRHNVVLHKRVKRNWRGEESEFKCNECPKVFKYKECLYHHIKNCHTDPVPLECSICKSKLKSMPYLRSHMRRVHYNDGKLHKCGICGKEFKSPRYVNVHIKNSHSKKDDVRVYKVKRPVDEE